MKPPLSVLVAVTWLACLLCASSQEQTEKTAWRIFCFASPALNTWKNATPASFEAAIRARDLHHEVDEHGEGIVWGLAHWVEIHNPPHQMDSVGFPGGFEFRATSHVLVFRECWTYVKDSKGALRKKEWVRKTVAHLTAGGANEEDPALRYRVEHDSRTKSKFKEVPFDSHARSNRGEPYPIVWKGKTIAWITSGWIARGNRFEADYGCIRSGKKGVPAKTGNRAGPMPTEGSIYLNWSFVVRRSAAGIKPDPGSPGIRLNFIIPPNDDASDPGSQ